MSKFSVVKVEDCPLCGGRPLCDRHSIPHFVFEWLRESSATGHIRAGDTPNLRIQDGIKQPLLCVTCEGLLSAWERQTAEQLFKPLHCDSKGGLPYGPWFAKFCASVCWRVLFIYRGLGLDHLPDEQLQHVDRALNFWHAFMFDRREHPGEFEFHVLPLTPLERAKGLDLPPNMNRYFARLVEADVVANSKSAFVQVKMCRLMVLGFIRMPDAREWKGSRVKMQRGIIGPAQNYNIPRNFFEYLIGRAKHAASVQADISDRQRKKIAAAMRGDLDRTAYSGTFEALSYDVSMFGPVVFEHDRQQLAKPVEDNAVSTSSPELSVSDGTPRNY